MADGRLPAALDDAGLEAALRDLGRALAYPPQRDLAPAVIARLREPAGGRHILGGAVRLRLRRLRVALVLAAALLALLAAAVAAGALGLPGIRILIGSSSPSLAPPATVGSPSRAASPAPSGPLGEALDLGRPVDPASLDRVVGHHVPFPAELGRPASAWVDTILGLPVVSLAWPASAALPEGAALTVRAPGVGAILTEIPATVDRPLLQKVLGPDTTLETVQVGARPGYWIAGAPHELLVLGRDGSVVALDTRLAGNTLLWTDSGLTYRLESGLSRDAAIGVAATTR